MIYCFKCPACDDILEEDHRIGHAPAEIMCPQCGGQAPRDYKAENHEIGDGKLANDAKYPYVSQNLKGTRAGEDCPQVDYTIGRKHRRTVKMPLVVSAKHERELAAKHHMVRD